MECPACGFENIPGADTCDACSTPLMEAEVQHRTLSEPLAQLLKDTKISALESGKPVFAQKDESIDECVRKMQEAEVGHVFVTDGDGKLLGIVTERDVLYKVMPTEDGVTSDAVESIMTPNPHVLSGDDSVSVLLNTMAVYGYRRVPVELEGGYAIITVRHLFEYLLTASTAK